VRASRLVQGRQAQQGGLQIQIIGNVGRSPAQVGRRLIIDPDKNPNKKYDVEITPLSDRKLKVMGMRAGNS
jgi:hypothetical protein